MYIVTVRHLLPVVPSSCERLTPYTWNPIYFSQEHIKFNYSNSQFTFLELRTEIFHKIHTLELTCLITQSNSSPWFLILTRTFQNPDIKLQINNHTNTNHLRLFHLHETEIWSYFCSTVNWSKRKDSQIVFKRWPWMACRT